MNLVIVESPTKAKTIGKFLGKEYTIKASMGHVIDLPKSTLGVDTEKGFKPQYELMEDKKQIIAELKSAAKSASQIILATDPDREGEAIASHVKDMLRSNEKLKIKNEKFHRIVFHEITKEAIEEALANPRLIDKKLVDAQTARRVLDRLVGYKLSPLLWQKVRRGLSAGRVQSVALRLIVEREKEIEKFKKEEYFTITVIARSPAVGGTTRQSSSKKIATPLDDLGARNDKEVQFELIEIDGKKIEEQETFNLYDGEYTVTKTTIAAEEQANDIVADMKTKKYVVADVIQKEMRRSPQPPFTTSTLQQDASRRLGFFGKRTMRAAQKLYEEGYITYHRTDSVNVSQAAITATRSFVKSEYGDRYLPPQSRYYKTKQKLAQEAHEAIRPTKVGQISNFKFQISNDVGMDGWKLYELIWRRAVASQMSDAVTESTTVIVDSQNQKSKIKDQKESTYRLKATGSVLLFDGFLKVNPFGLGDNKLPQFAVGETLNKKDIQAENHETALPPRYNDASLIKTLEEKGIGRPSTYAPIISTIEDRRYVERQEARFVPTSIGVAVNDFLVANFSDIDDIPFTAEMEDKLDAIVTGEDKWQDMMGEFYKPFEKQLVKVKDVKRVKIEVEKTDETCPECGAPLVIRMGRFGKFFSCSKFPECKYTKQFVEETGLACPKDGGKVIVKKTRKGRKFFGCSNYPACEFAAWKLEDIPGQQSSVKSNEASGEPRP